MRIELKIAITPKPNNLTSYSILDLVSINGRAYLSLTDNNTPDFGNESKWKKITENPYDLAKRSGYIGTESEWLNSLSGAPGLSAYQIWVAQEDNIGKTQEEYLEWLQKPAVDAAAQLTNIDLSFKADHGYSEGETPKTLKELEQEIDLIAGGEMSPEVLNAKADHGYSEGETPKTLKQIEEGVDAMANAVGGFPVISPEGKIPIEVIPSLQEVFSARQNFNDFTGSVIEITTSSIPESHDGVFIYVNGILLFPLRDYTIASDTITLTQPIVTPSDVCVIWFLDRNEYYGRPPSRINNLSVALISSKSIMLHYSAAGAHGNQDLCEKYRIYYSTVEITENNYLSANYIDVTSGIMPYGVQMSTIISGLDSGKIYYFAVSGFAKNKYGLLSNVVMAKTDDVFMPSTVGYVLPVTKYDVYDFLHHLKEVPAESGGSPGDYYKVEYMVNGNIVEENGIVQETSEVGYRMFAMTYTGFKNTWTNYSPYELIIDLKEIKRVDSIFINYDKIVEHIHIWTSSLGANFAHAATVSGYETEDTWLTVPIPEAYSYARYIRLTFPSEVAIREFAVYGASLQASLPTGSKIGGLRPKQRFEYFAGTNAFFTNIISDVANFGRRVRFYSNWEWYPTMEQTVQAGIKLYGDTSGNGEITYRFSNNRVQGDLDQKLQDYKILLDNKYGAAPTSTYICFKGAMPFQWLDSNGNVRPFSLVGNNRMQDKSVYPEYDSRSPWAYRMYSQFLFTFTARYGRATGLNESLMAVDPSNTKLQGLDLVKYIELENEPDRNWNESQDTYYHPEELAAMVSACYDGHMGQLGPGFGIKQADPTMKVVLPGLKSQNSGYIKRMMLWFESNRTEPGYDVYPFDVMAFHYYHNTAGGQTNAATRKGISPDSIKPNKAMDDGGTLYDTMKYIADWRDREKPNLELWIGEFGYDEHPQSLQSVNPQAGKTLGQLKADFIMRSYMHIIAAGLDAAHQYMYRNDTQQSLLESVSYQNTYLGSGFVDYINDSRDINGNFYLDSDPAKYPPLASYYYIRNLVSHLTGMKFSHILRIAGNTHVEDILINVDELDPTLKNICGIAFTPDEDDETLDKIPCIVLWLGQEQAASTVAHVAVDSEVLEINLTTFNNAENYPSSYGATTTLTPISGPHGKYVQVPINGTPCILWTNYIGKKKIEAPVLNAYVPSASEVRLYWTDKNEESYKIIIYKYNNSTEMYEEIVNQLTTSSEYDVSGLSPNTSYKFIAKFVDHTDVALPESEYSNIVEFTTPALLPLVTNVEVGSVSFNRIEFTWDYDIAFESITEGFRIYRSSTPTGTYSLIAQVARELRSYTNYGLLEGTTYYYKIAPYSSIAYGTPTGYIGFTTLEENSNPPIVLSANTDYFGEKIILQFNIPLSTTISVISKITVYDPNNGSPRILSISASEYLPDPMKLILTLSQPITHSGTGILIGYDGTGTLTSAYGVPVAQFIDTSVTNMINSSSLVSRKIQVKFNRAAGTSGFTAFDVPSGNNAWNQLSKTQVSISNVKDSTGGITDIVISKPKTSPAWQGTSLGSGFTSDPDQEELTGKTFTVGDFASWVNGSGANINKWTPFGALSQLVGFHNLRSDKDYYIEYVITTATPSNDAVYKAQEFTNNIAQKVISVKNNTTQIFKTSKITPIVCPSSLVAQTIPLFTSPSVYLGFRSINDAGTATSGSSILTGAMLIEVHRE